MKRNLLLNQTAVSVNVSSINAERVSFDWAGSTHTFELIQRTGDTVVLRDAQGGQHRLQVTSGLISGCGLDAEIVDATAGAKKKAAVLGGLNAPMPGKVFKVLVKTGEAVVKGQTLLVLEAMKMEHAIKADKDGKVRKILFKEGDLVQGGMALAELE
jgi:biotin carboxyl carrier protein